MTPVSRPAAPRRVLLVSPHFPPINAPDHQRVRMSLPYYAKLGWEPVVLAIHPDDVAVTREDELCETYPKTVRVEYCRAWSLRWTRWFGIGNLGWRAWWPFLRTGTRLLRQERFDLVFFSNTQFVTFVLGAIWRWRFGVPYVIDIQDPWRTNYYERPGAPRPPGGRKYLLARVVARLAEKPIYRRAAGFVSVSPQYLDDLAHRYPWFAAKPQATIRFGTTPEDFAAARRLTNVEHTLPRQPGEVHLLYTGAAGPIMPHAINVLLEGLRRFRASHPAPAARLRLHFWGTSYVAKGAGKYSVLPIAQARQVADLVTEIPYRLGHLECLRLLSQADALMLLGSNDRAYSPSKLYPYYLSGKPIVSVVFRGSYLEKILQELGCSYIVTFESGESLDAAYTRLDEFFQSALNGFPPTAWPPRNDAFFNGNFLAENLTAQQCALFEAAVAGTASGRTTVATNNDQRTDITCVERK